MHVNNPFPSHKNISLFQKESMTNPVSLLHFLGLQRRDIAASDHYLRSRQVPVKMSGPINQTRYVTLQLSQTP